MNNENMIAQSRYVLILSSIAAFIVAFISTAPTVALPEIAKQFVLTNFEQNWVLNAFLFSVAIFTVPFGKVSGKLGIKRSFFIGMLIFLIGSVITVVAFDGISLIACRIFQGIGAAFIYDTMTTIVTLATPVEKRGNALGILIAFVYIGLATAPVFGGVLTYNLGWEAIFYFTIPFCLVVLFLLYFKTKSEWTPYENEKLDYPGSILYSIGILLTIYGFSSITTLEGGIIAIVGVILLILFGYFELKVKTPIFKMTLFKDNDFKYSNLASFVSYIATFILTYLINYHFQYTLNLNAQISGILLIATPLLMAIFAVISGKISEKINPRTLSIVGMALVTLSMFMLIFLKGLSLELIIIAMMIQGTGIGLFVSPITNIIMSSVPGTDTPFASVSLTFVRVVGQSCSLAMVSIIFTLIMGNVILNSSKIPELLLSSKITFLISTILCAIATVLCFKLNKNKIQEEVH